MKARIESFEDIVFENRNKAYGAYELRKKYSKHGTIALLISIGLFSFALAGPLIANILNNRNFERLLTNNTVVELEGIQAEKPDIKLPEPPPETIDIKQVRFTAPTIVEEISEPYLELDINDELVENANPTDIDTTSKLIIVDKPTNDFDDDSKIKNVFDIQEKPMFPGGDSELLKFIATTAIYPEAAIDGGIEGTVYIRFVVTKSGKIGKTLVLRSIDPILDDEALRVVKALPSWIPGKHNGEPVNVWFIVPVKFELK